MTSSDTDLSGHPAAPPPPTGRLWAELAGDRTMQLFFLGWLAVLVPYLLFPFGYTPSGIYRDYLAFALLGALVATASFFDLGRQTRPEERRIRLFTGYAFSVWFVAALVALAFRLWALPSLAAAEDTLYVVFYVLFAFAALDETRSGRRREPRLFRRLRRLESAVFATGIFVYAVVLPSRLDPESFGSELPSTFLYVTLDLFVLALFALRLRSATERRDRQRWQLMTAAALGFALTDSLYFVSLAGRIDIVGQPALDLLWYLPHLAAVAAVRVPVRDELVAEEVVLDDSELAPTPFAPALLYAGLVPAIHLIAESTGVVSPNAADMQRLWAFALVIVLGILAAVHQSLIVRAHRALADEIVLSRRRLATANKLEAIGRLAAGVAHDFNNLLTVILGRSELMLARQQSEETRRDLESVLRASERAADLTAQLLAVGQRGTEQRRRVEIGEFLSRLVPELAELCGPQVRIVPKLAGEPMTLEADPTHLVRIARNLAANARDAMPAGGELTIDTSLIAVERTERIRDEELTPGRYVAIGFHDSGEGMDRATLGRLFEPFFTTKAMGRGTGLGLATVYGLVRQNGGQIRVVSRPGAGARFELLFPRLEPADG